MIFGTGCDISEVERVKEVFNTRERLEKCFTEKEIAFLEGRPERIAGNFSAKEAFAKALGRGFKGFSLKDTEILRDEFGRPFISGDSLKLILQKTGIYHELKVMISISHERKFAMATCVIELINKNRN